MKRAIATLESETLGDILHPGDNKTTQKNIRNNDHVRLKFFAGSWQSWQLIPQEWLSSSARWILRHSHRRKLNEKGFSSIENKGDAIRGKLITCLVNSTLNLTWNSLIGELIFLYNTSITYKSEIARKNIVSKIINDRETYLNPERKFLFNIKFHSDCIAKHNKLI